MYVQNGTGVPMVSKELEGRKGKGSNGRAHTREVKLGCAFTQTTVDAAGWPVRDEDSTTYTGAIETAEEFSRRLYTEAQQRGWDRAQKKVVMGDGAEWIWNRTQEIFPGATEIVDLYHARQHLWDLSSKPHPSDVAAKRRWVMSHQHFLDDGKIELLVNRLRALGTQRQELAEEIETEASYFERNAARMRYPKFRKHGLRGDRSGLQNPHRHPSQTLRNVLDRSRRQRGHRRPLLPSQPRIRQLLGVPPAMMPLPSRAPTVDCGSTERWVGSCRRDLLDHVIILNERHLKRLMSSYLLYYHEDRTHLGLAKDTPAGRHTEIPIRSARERKIQSFPRLGGLHHRYAVAA